MKVSFNDIKYIFAYYPIWYLGKEHLWYEKAWSAMDEAGLTEYDKEIDRTLILIRVFTLIMLYGEYCELACGEYFAYEFLDWQEVAEISAFRIGQLAAIKSEQDYREYDEYEDQDALKAAFMDLMENERYKVADMLIRHIGDGAESEVLVSLYLSCHDMYDIDDDIDCNESQKSEFEEYLSDINKYFDDIVTNLTMENMAVIDWLAAGTYRIR